MIHVKKADEPTDFGAKVRTPGVKFLSSCPNPVGQQWKNHDYWRKALGDLYTSYNGVCSYCASWTKRGAAQSNAQDSSVDHFVPRSIDATLAYEWTNYRLCRTRLNTRKDSHQDVLDPFTLANGWFTIDFRTFLLRPNSSLSVGDQANVQKTIDRLGLNTDNDYVTERSTAVKEYCLGNATLSQLDDKYPFIAHEVRRQDFDTVFLPGMRAFFRRNP